MNSSNEFICYFFHSIIHIKSEKFSFQQTPTLPVTLGKCTMPTSNWPDCTVRTAKIVAISQNLQKQGLDCYYNLNSWGVNALSDAHVHHREEGWGSGLCYNASCCCFFWESACPSYMYKTTCPVCFLIPSPYNWLPLARCREVHAVFLLHTSQFLQHNTTVVTLTGKGKV